MTAIQVSQRELMKNVTLTVEVTDVQMTAARLTIGTWLLKLAARVIGCSIDVTIAAEN